MSKTPEQVFHKIGNMNKEIQKYAYHVNNDNNSNEGHKM